ncbi:AurF N-oxygenase family protein [Nocardia arizonensis]|uniref:AurF N-oxygenase family protein n=1 Tax=Nocardia arizonensis TaxID=1141647 RepID=UPI0006D103FF|nr:diiron oxygenase [Nocardia arizonensis]
MASTAPDLPVHDPADPVESAVINRLAANWGRRASVKRDEPDLLEFFDPLRPDFPEALIPFRDHPAYLRLPRTVRDRLNAWGWIAFNKNVIDIEQHVVNPGFQALADDAFGTGLGDTLIVAATQAMVDEQYHTLMHVNACVATRKARGWALSERHLPLSHKVRSHRRDHDAAAIESPGAAAVVSLAYTTVAEISINAYLDLVAKDRTVQPFNRTTADLHSRDEYCHSSVAAELAGIVYHDMRAEDRRLLLDTMARAMDAFAATDLTTWSAILEYERIPDAERIVADVREGGGPTRLLQDFSGLHRLCLAWDVMDDIPFDWSRTTVDTPLPDVPPGG